MKKNILIKIKNLNNWLKNYVANFKASNYLKAYLGISFVLIIIFLLYLILDNYGILDKISSPEELQKIIQSKYHFVSALVYFAIQFLQVSVLPIPAMVTTAAGVFVFGNWYEPAIYSLLAIIPASMLAFFVGRKLGKPFVSWMVGKENVEKYLNKTQGKERPIFFMMFLLPLFPDDALCMIAGITKITYKFFFIMQLICRPPAILLTILMFNGVINKDILSTWYGVVIVIILAFLFLLTIYLTFKYSDKIEKLFVKIENKIYRKNQKTNQ